MPAQITLALTPTVHRDFLTPEHLQELASLGTVVTEPDATDHQLEASADALVDAEVVLLGWGTARLTDDVLDAMPRLGAVVHTGGSVRSLVPESAYDRGIRISSQTALNAVPVAEYAAAMIMLAAKQTLRSARVYAELRREVDRSALFRTAGAYRCRVGIIGLSRISRHVIRLLAPLDLDVVVASAYLDDEEAAALGVTRVPLDELLTTSRVVSLHSASLDRTRRLLGARELALLPDGATFLNTARGDVVDQDALVDELRTGRIDAILDVADPDVTVPASPLWTMPNVLLTPHFAGAVGTELYRLGEGAVTNVTQYLAGEPMTGEVTREQYRTQA